MAEIRNLADLEKLVGIRTVEKCFIEYMLSTMTKANRLEDLENKRAIMDEDEMNKFIEKIGRCELYEEVQDSKLRRGERFNMQWNGYPRYIKAVRVSLVAMGYDEQWVDTEFRDAIEKKYLGYNTQNEDE